MELTPLHYGLIALGVLALLFLIMWLVSASKRKSEKEALAQQHEQDKHALKTSLDAKAEEERLAAKKTYAEEKERYDDKLQQQEIQIDSLKLLSKDTGEYLTDFALIQLKERLVRSERIRPEDMYVLANIFIPGKDIKRTTRLAHIVLTRTGIYLLESHYWQGHVYHGVDQSQFSVDPMLEHLFSMMDLDPYIEQSIAMEKDADGRVYFTSFKSQLDDLKAHAEMLETTLKLPYPVVPIMYFNKESNDAGTLDNFSRDKKVKVIVGEDELDMFFEKYVFHGRFQYSVEELADIRDSLEHINP